MLIEPNMLEPLGLTQEEERVYSLLLAQPGATVAEIAAASRLSRGKAQNALSSLEDKALVGRSPGNVPRFSPSPPDIALESLVYRRHEEIERARAQAAALAERVFKPVPSAGAADLIEIVTGEEAVYQRTRQVDLNARKEVMVLSRPPYVMTDTQAERDKLLKGVAYRFIYDHAALEYPHHLEYIQEDVKAGEQARVLSELPMKMTIADRRTAIMSLNIKEPDTKSALAVRASSLLDALIILFETLWERAVPLDLHFSKAAEPSSSPSEEDQRLVALLGTGLKDEAVARNMGMTSRTLRRRISRLMHELGAQNRFQLAWIAAQRYRE